MNKTTTSVRTSRARPSRSTGGSSKLKRAFSRGRVDWQAIDSLTDEQVVARAMTDADNKPLTKHDLRRMRRRPRAYVVRRALGMTQEAFAEAYCIPIGTLRDWEQGQTEPDQANRAYLKVIAVAPVVVKQALMLRPGQRLDAPE